jgi:hypothetical protein
MVKRFLALISICFLFLNGYSQEKGIIKNLKRTPISIEYTESDNL